MKPPDEKPAEAPSNHESLIVFDMMVLLQCLQSSFRTLMMQFLQINISIATTTTCARQLFQCLSMWAIWVSAKQTPIEALRIYQVGAMDVTKPCKFISFGDMHGPKPCNFTAFRWAIISQTPVEALKVCIVACSCRLRSRRPQLSSRPRGKRTAG